MQRYFQSLLLGGIRSRPFLTARQFLLIFAISHLLNFSKPDRTWRKRGPVILHEAANPIRKKSFIFVVSRKFADFLKLGNAL